MICQRLRYYFAHEVLEVYPGGLLPHPGCTPGELSGTIDYTASEKAADPGKTLSETARVRSRETGSPLLRVKEPRLVLELSVGDGRTIIMGSPAYPATLLVTENPPEMTFTFSAATPAG
jgi:hypothetical protein